MNMPSEGLMLFSLNTLDHLIRTRKIAVPAAVEILKRIGVIS
jgi:hypothetical protein